MVVVVVLVVVVLVVVVVVGGRVVQGGPHTVVDVVVVVHAEPEQEGLLEETLMPVARSSAHGSSFLLHVVSLYCAFVSPSDSRFHLIVSRDASPA